MWSVNPENLCQQHLLGEHVEMHMFAGTIKKNISIQGYIKKGLVNPKMITTRHEQLAQEMKRRGLNHNSPLCFDSSELPMTLVDVKKNEIELRKRCKKCFV